MQIKQQTFGTGRPLVCVPVVERKEEEIYQAAKSAVSQGAEVLEWRMDWFADIFQWQQTSRILCNLQEICGDVILLSTFRSKPQGGECDISEDTYQELLERTAQTKCADLLDVEACRLTEAPSVMHMLHDLGQYVIGSNHYFSHTPETEQMKQDIMEMRWAGADIGKLAVMPHSPMDVVRLLEITAQMKEEYPEYPLVTMAMGGLGAVSRISGQAFGSCMTFASYGKVSAPGQMPVKDVMWILDKLSESMEL